MAYTITEEMLNKQKETAKKNVHYYALAEYKDKLLKLLEKEKKTGRKSKSEIKRSACM